VEELGALQRGQTAAHWALRIRDCRLGNVGLSILPQLLCGAQSSGGRLILPEPEDYWLSVPQRWLEFHHSLLSLFEVELFRHSSTLELLHHMLLRLRHLWGRREVCILVIPVVSHWREVIVLVGGGLLWIKSDSSCMLSVWLRLAALVDMTGSWGSLYHYVDLWRFRVMAHRRHA
jgi:hypothetical protein